MARALARLLALVAAVAWGVQPALAVPSGEYPGLGSGRASDRLLAQFDRQSQQWMQQQRQQDMLRQQQMRQQQQNMLRQQQRQQDAMRQQQLRQQQLNMLRRQQMRPPSYASPRAFPQIQRPFAQQQRNFTRPGAMMARPRSLPLPSRSYTGSNQARPLARPSRLTSQTNYSRPIQQAGMSRSRTATQSAFPVRQRGIAQSAFRRAAVAQPFRVPPPSRRSIPFNVAYSGVGRGYGAKPLVATSLKSLGGSGVCGLGRYANAPQIIEEEILNWFIDTKPLGSYQTASLEDKYLVDRKVVTDTSGIDKSYLAANCGGLTSNFNARSGTTYQQIHGARFRQQAMIKDNKGYNISPTSWDRFPTLGHQKTYLTDRLAMKSILEHLPSGAQSITITRQKAAMIERELGLKPQSLQSGFKIRRVTNLMSMGAESPGEGNEYFLGRGNHLPGGHPEMGIRPIGPHDSENVKTLVEVKIE